MPTEYVSGDLFDNEYKAQAFAHGCNCQGSMGAGIAVGFRERYPAMFEQFRALCKSEPRQFNLGTCWLWKADEQPWVFNLGTQEKVWRARASYEAIETALTSMRTQADHEGLVRIAIPRIGVGYGGLSWKKVRAIVNTIFENWSGSLFVYETFVPSEKNAVPSRTPKRKTVSTGSTRVKDRIRNNIENREDRAVKDAIRFYSVSEEYGCFSNFSPHPIRLKGKTWPTSEHYFQAQKFAGHPDETEIREAKSPMIAARMGRSRKRPLRKDWESVKNSIMHEAVLTKFTQHQDLREILLGSGEAEIIEHTTNDDYWGDGGDGRGKNKLGEILMRVRKELREG